MVINIMVIKGATVWEIVQLIALIIYFNLYIIID